MLTKALRLRPLLALCLLTTATVACDSEQDPSGFLEDDEVEERRVLGGFSTSIASWDQSIQDLRQAPRDLDDLADRCDGTELRLDYPSGTVLRFDGNDISRSTSGYGCAQYWNSSVDLGDDPSALASLHLPAPHDLDEMLATGWTVQSIELRTNSGSSFDCGYNIFEPASGPYGERHRVSVEVSLRKGNSYTTRSRWIMTSNAPDIELRWTSCRLPTLAPVGGGPGPSAG